MRLDKKGRGKRSMDNINGDRDKRNRGNINWGKRKKKGQVVQSKEEERQRHEKH